MTTTTYKIALDKNGDGFVNTDAQPTDPPNLLPTPVTYASLPKQLENPTNRLTQERDDFPYGAAYDHCNILVLTATGYYIGTSNFASGTINTIAVTPGTTYTAVCWLRGTAGYATAPMSLSIYDQTKTQITTTSITLTGDWVRYTRTFTPGGGVTHLCIAVEKGASGAGVEYDAAGFMLVAGPTAPATFNAGDDLDDFITEDVLSLEWRLGLAKPYDSTAALTIGTMTLRNEDRRNSPTFPLDTGQTPLLPGRKIRVLAIRESVTYKLFTGQIDRVEPAPGTLGPRTTMVHLVGAEKQLATTQVLTELMTTVDVDSAIDQILDNQSFSNLIMALDDGVINFAYVGDTWGDGVPALLPIRQLTDAERGRFFTDRRGRLVFYNRNHLKSVVASAETFDQNFEALGYIFGRDLVNAVRVAVQPRAVGSAGSTIWQLENAQLIPPGVANTRTIIARLRDSNDRPIGATTVIAPVATTDYTANTLANGSVTNVTAFVSVTVLEAQGSAATLQVTSTYHANVYLMPGSKLRGTPLIQADPITVEQTDLDSILAYGTHPLEFDMPYLVTIEEADSLAREELRRRKNPFGAVTSLAISNVQHPTAILARTLFDRITVKDVQARHESDYFIVAEAHNIDMGGARHCVTWLLEPANPGDYWQLGRSALGQTTKLSIRY